jgi:hypothetical protein
MRGELVRVSKVVLAHAVESSDGHRQQRAEDTRETVSMRARCEGCKALVQDFEITSCGSMSGGYKELCCRCFNGLMAARSGLPQFQHVDFAPVVLVDCARKSHKFYFTTRLLGDILVLEAFELRKGIRGGYQFKLIGNPEEDTFELLRRLLERMRRALSVRHLRRDGMGMSIAKHNTVRGRIEWDDKGDGRLPLLTIDGKDIDWEEFGRILMTYEGFQFKLEIRDASEEV